MPSRDVTPGKNGSWGHTWQTLVEFTLPSKPGNERLAVNRVTEAMQGLNWPKAHLTRLELALSRATLKAIERSPLHGSAETWLSVRVLIPEEVWARQRADSASHEPARPPPHGWGFFLIERTVPAAAREVCYLIELFLYLEGEKHDRKRC